jgi:type IV fimbrial biogenesis protein FimT
VKVTFSALGPTTNWCYGTQVPTTASPNCDCTITDVTNASACQLDGVLRVTNGTNYPGVSMKVSFVGSGANQRTTGFNARQGTAQTGGAGAAENGTVTLDYNADELQVIVSLLGRVRICTTTGVPGYQSCS